MRGRTKWAVPALAAAWATAAPAQLVDPATPAAPALCAMPSGLGANTCIVPRSETIVETTLVDWTHDLSDGVRDDTVLVAQTVARIGVAHGLEAQLGWTPYGHERVLDRTTGARYGAYTVGDVTLGLKTAVVAASQRPFSLAVQPYVVLPVGRAPVGSGKVGGGVAAPLGYDLSARTTIEVTPEVDLLGNQDGRRRHFEYNLTAGVAQRLAPLVFLTGEYRLLRNEDPLHERTTNMAALSLAWQPRARLQLDAGAAVGLTPDSPALELLIGFARRFR